VSSNTLPDQQLTVLDLLQVFSRRRRTIYWTSAGLFLAAVLLCIFTTRQYQASGTIQIQRDGSDGLDPNTLLGTSQSSMDALSADINIQTQVSILKSNTLALRTIKELKLDNTKEFRYRPSLFKGVSQYIRPAEHSNDQSDNSPDRQASLLKIFRNNLSIRPLPGTRLVEINYSSTDPALAAATVNQLVKELVDYTFETKYKTTEMTSRSLSEQLADLRTQSQRLQAQVAQMQRETGLYSMGATDASGRQQAYSAVLDQFQHASSLLSDTVQNRILKEAIYKAAKSGDAEFISSLAGNSGLGAGSSGIMNSLSTVQNLRTQQGLLQGQLDQLKVKFGPGYPQREELQQNIQGLQSAIQQEMDRIAKRAANDYSVANQTYETARRNYDQLKGQADNLNNKTIQYMITRQEADESRSLYEDLLKRLKEAGILQGLKSNTISIVDPALVPAKPAKPNVPLDLLAAAGIGIFLGSFLALLFDALDDRIYDLISIEGMRVPVLGVLPNVVEGSYSPFLAQGAYGDSLRVMRLGLMTNGNMSKPRVISITSATPLKFKKEISMHIAMSFAHSGKRVLLIDADMRRPSTQDVFDISGENGLSLVLTGEPIAAAIKLHPKVPKLSVLPAGPMPLSPSELLESEQMRNLLHKLVDEFDLIVIDSPPALGIVDALVLSGLADLTFQVVQLGMTKRSLMKRAHDLLSEHSRQPVGVIVSGIKENSNVYQSYYGYSRTYVYNKDEIHEAA
jgi:succinoglycan biosynthesis transport protein ExoP